MTENELKWTVESEEQALHTPVFDVLVQHEVASTGLRGDYIAVSAPDWVMVIPELGDEFIMVRQYRHASKALSLEFPGGVIDRGEAPAQAAARELYEETGMRAGRLIALGVCRPNPALFDNRFHVYLARDLVSVGEQQPDDDELLSCLHIPKEAVLSGFGSGEMTHALMGAALAFYRAFLEREKTSPTCKTDADMLP